MTLVTAAQMRAIEHAAIKSGRVSGLELMEQAGFGAVQAIFETWPEKAALKGKAVVLCGPGNNGGDGFVVARLLAERGWSVAVYQYGDEAKLPPDAAENCRRWREIGGISPIAELDPDDLLNGDAHLVIDALFGTGMKRTLPEHLGEIAKLWGDYDVTSEGRHLVSLDLPSGIDSDSGKAVGGVAFNADLTVTFGWCKLGHLLAEGPAMCGEVVTAPLSISSRDATYALRDHYGLEQPFRLSRFMAGIAQVECPQEKGEGHKYSHGHVLVLSGGMGKGGAARLAARGALRIGAGAVTIGAPPSAIIEHATQLNAIMLQRTRGVDDLTMALSDKRMNAVVIGPGLGVGEQTCAYVKAALASSQERGAVLDADALSSFSADPEALFRLTRGTRTVLTPHMGEFGRLFPDIHANLHAPATRGPAYSKVDAVRDAAARAGCLILLKGQDTVICDEDGVAIIAAAVRERACPWLATAGAGDVLAGFIAGLMARGFSALQAAEEGAFLHQECARSFGPGLIAEDLPEELPKVLRAFS